MRRFAEKAFTLIELLVVVSIISILASIALTNYQEAQVRAKISAAANDMRVIELALTAYFTEHNAFPPNPSIPVEKPPVLPAGYARPSSYNVTPTLLTSPVAYMTSLPHDPFRTPGAYVYDYFYPAYKDQIPRYSYYTVINEDEWWRLREQGTIVSPIATHALPPPDAKRFEGEFFFNAGAYDKYGSPPSWVQWSAGPDGVLWREKDDFSIPGDPGSPLAPLTRQGRPWGWSFDVPYDPTNGTVSFGNIIRNRYQSPHVYRRDFDDGRPHSFVRDDGGWWQWLSISGHALAAEPGDSVAPGSGTSGAADDRASSMNQYLDERLKKAMGPGAVPVSSRPSATAVLAKQSEVKAIPADSRTSQSLYLKERSAMRHPARVHPHRPFSWVGFFSAIFLLAGLGLLVLYGYLWWQRRMDQRGGPEE